MQLFKQNGDSLVTVLVSVGILGIATLSAIDLVRFSLHFTEIAEKNKEWDVQLDSVRYMFGNSSECNDLFYNDSGNTLLFNTNYLEETPVSELKWRGSKFLKVGEDVEKMSLVNYSITPVIRPIYDNSVPPVLIENHNRYSAIFTVTPKHSSDQISKIPQDYMVFIETDLNHLIKTCYMNTCGQGNPPQAFSDFATVAMGQSVLISVLSNDLDTNPERRPLRLVSVDNPSSGTAELASGLVKYTAGSTTGDISFNYTITDGCIESKGIITVKVMPKLDFRITYETLIPDFHKASIIVSYPGGTDSPGRFLRYTTNGTEPNCSTSSYVGPFSTSDVLLPPIGAGGTGSGSTRIKAIFCKAGNVEAIGDIWLDRKTWYAGTSSIVVPSGTNKVWISLFGAGGGGAGGFFPAYKGGGGGGGGGSAFLCPFTVTPGDIFYFSVGVAGIGSRFSDGANGGNTFIYLNSNANILQGYGGKGGKTGNPTTAGSGGDSGGALFALEGWSVSGKSGASETNTGTAVTIADRNGCLIPGGPGGGGGVGPGPGIPVPTKSGWGGNVLTVAGGSGILVSTAEGGPGGGGGATLFGIGSYGYSTDNPFSFSGTGGGGGGGGGGVGDPVVGNYIGTGGKYGGVGGITMWYFRFP